MFGKCPNRTVVFSCAPTKGESRHIPIIAVMFVFILVLARRVALQLVISSPSFVIVADVSLASSKSANHLKFDSGPPDFVSTLHFHVSLPDPCLDWLICVFALCISCKP